MPDLFHIAFEVVVILALVSFLSSIISGVLGMIGGVFLVVAGTFFMPIDEFLPIHAVVMLICTFSRVLMGWKNLDKKVWLQFSWSNAIGTFGGTYFVVFMNQQLTFILCNIFLFMGTWTRMLTFNFKGGLTVLGALHGGLSGMIGSTGPVAMPTLIHRYQKTDYEKVVITHSSLMMNSHLFRMVAFGFWGTAYFEMIPVIVVLGIGSLLGSFVGTKIRHQIRNQELFLKYLKILISILVLLNLTQTLMT